MTYRKMCQSDDCLASKLGFRIGITFVFAILVTAIVCNIQVRTKSNYYVLTTRKIDEGFHVLRICLCKTKWVHLLHYANFKKETLSKSILCKYFVRKVANKSSYSIRHNTPMGHLLAPFKFNSTYPQSMYLFTKIQEGVLWRKAARQSPSTVQTDFLIE